MFALGRGRVCARVKGDLERPSDIDGVAYVDMDAGGAWQFELVTELRAAGLAEDANKLIPESSR